MLLKILIGLIVVIAVFLVYVALKGSHYKISREVTVNAPAAKVFPYLNNRTLANSWNPWLKMDTNLKLTVSGPETGVGSVTAWADGKNTGTGSATVIESVPNERVIIRLDYKKPFEMTQEAMYLVRSAGNQTTVEWKIEGENKFFARVMCTFMSMDKMVGDTFTKGLLEMKALVENSK